MDVAAAAVVVSWVSSFLVSFDVEVMASPVFSTFSAVFGNLLFF